MGANLKIGATVDVAELQEGMNQSVGAIREAAERIPIAFGEMAGRTKVHLARISDDAKELAKNVSADMVEIAQSTKGVIAAQKDLRESLALVKEGKLDDATATGLLAASEVRLRKATEEQAAALKAQARSIEEEAEKAELSQNGIIRALQRTALAAKEASAEIQEAAVGVAEKGSLAGFGALAGEAAGVGILLSFVAEWGQELSKSLVELGHLHVETGIATQDLAGLQQIVKSMGGDWEGVSTGLLKFEKALGSIDEPSKNLEQALDGVHVKLSDLQAASKDPERALQIVATAFAGTEDHAKLAAAAVALFGRGGYQLIPILKEMGSQLSGVMKQTGEQTGVTEEAVEQARRWTAETARLSLEFKAALIPSLGIVGESILGVIGTLHLAADIIATVFETAGAIIVSFSKGAIASVSSLGKEFHDLLTGNFSQLAQDSQAPARAFAGVWGDWFEEIKRHWHAVSEDFSYSPVVPKDLPTFDTDGDAVQGSRDGQSVGRGGGRGAAGAAKGRISAIQQAEAELNQMRLAAEQEGHQLSLLDEATFWQNRLNAAERGSKDYIELVAKLVPVLERLRKGVDQTATVDVKTQTFSDISQTIADLNAEANAAKQAAKIEMEADREKADGAIRDAADQYRGVKESLDEEVRQHKISKSQEIQQLKEALNEEYKLELASIRQKEILDSNDPLKYQQDLNKELQLTRQFNQNMKSLNMQMTDVWKAALDKITADFNQSVLKWVQTGKGFEQSLAQSFNGIAQNFVSNLLKMTEQEIAAAATHKALLKQGILGDAKSAAAATYKTVAEIPYVGPFIAPAAAAAAFAAVIAFQSFADGGVVQQQSRMQMPFGSVPILAHAGERVLTPGQSANFERLVNSSSGKSTTNHFNFENSFHAQDRTGMKAMVRSMEPEFIDMMKRAWKNGKLA
jgi:hypothetical protein